MDQGVNMPKIVLDHEVKLWAQLQVLQCQVVDQILSGDISRDWVRADQWLANELEELEPAHYVVSASIEHSPEETWSAYHSAVSRLPFHS